MNDEFVINSAQIFSYTSASTELFADRLFASVGEIMIFALLQKNLKKVGAQYISPKTDILYQPELEFLITIGKMF